MPPTNTGSNSLQHRQYRRVYILIPPNMSLQRIRLVVQAVWPYARPTIGFSADDAGVGDLDERIVIAISPEQWPGNLKLWFDTYYPGITYVPIVYQNEHQLRGRVLAAVLRHAIGLRFDCPSTHNPPLVTCEFGVPRKQTFHWGLDIRASSAVWGDRVTCAVGGTVIHCADEQDGLGTQVHVETNLVIGREIRKLVTKYGHLVPGSTAVRCGQSVVYGQLIGLPGHSGATELDHLHVQVELDGIPVDPNCIIGWQPATMPPPPPPPPPPAHKTSVGMHDGLSFMYRESIRGYAVVPLYVGDSGCQVIHAMPEYASRGINTIVRINYGWATADNGLGTVPPPEYREGFINAAVDTINANPSAWGFIIGNEVNSPREHPRDCKITPSDYIAIYNAIADRTSCRLAPFAPDPTNAQSPDWADWRITWAHCLSRAHRVGFVPIHAYTHGPDASLVYDAAVYGPPIAGVYQNLRMAESQINAIPAPLRKLPVIVTETNHLTRSDGQDGWEPDNTQWIAAAFSYFTRIGVDGVVFYRYSGDKWVMEDKPKLLAAIKQLA